MILLLLLALLPASAAAPAPRSSCPAAPPRAAFSYDAGLLQSLAPDDQKALASAAAADDCARAAVVLGARLDRAISAFKAEGAVAVKRASPQQAGDVADAWPLATDAQRDALREALTAYFRRQLFAVRLAERARGRPAVPPEQVEMWPEEKSLIAALGADGLPVLSRASALATGDADAAPLPAIATKPLPAAAAAGSASPAPAAERAAAVGAASLLEYERRNCFGQPGQPQCAQHRAAAAAAVRKGMAACDLWRLLTCSKAGTDVSCAALRQACR
jgi:hypothetical protein